MTVYQFFAGSETFGEVKTIDIGLDLYLLVKGVGYVWIHKDNRWGMLIKLSIQDLCVDCKDDCVCLDHPWFNLKKKPAPINYLNPYR